jgi:hypothetical protein
MLRELVEGSRAAFVQNERVHKPELQSKKEKYHSKHEVAIAINVHEKSIP